MRCYRLQGIIVFGKMLKSVRAELLCMLKQAVTAELLVPEVLLLML